MKKSLAIIVAALCALSGCGQAQPISSNQPMVPALGPPTEQSIQLKIDTAGMYPTIPAPCTVKVVTSQFAPFPGEVVAFHFPDAPTQTLIKRIIGMPGETVDIHDGHVWINGKVLNEPYVTGATDGNWGPYHVPANAYFVLGDNRSVSDDSRFWVHSYVDQDLLVGEVTEVVAPADKVKKFQ